MHYLMGYNPSSRTTCSQGQRLSSSCLSKIRPTCSVIPLKDSKVIFLFFATYKSIKYKMHLYKAYGRLLFSFWSEYCSIRTYVRTYRRSCDIFVHEMCVVKRLRKKLQLIVTLTRDTTKITKRTMDCILEEILEMNILTCHWGKIIFT